MKSIVSRMVAVLMVGALTGVVAFAKVHKQKVTFENDVKVSGTLVKKGNYEVQVTPGYSKSELGKTTKASFKVV